MAFVIDVFACRILGWHVRNFMQIDLVFEAPEQGLYDRQPECKTALALHSKRGIPYVSIRYTKRLAGPG